MTYERKLAKFLIPHFVTECAASERHSISSTDGVCTYRAAATVWCAGGMVADSDRGLVMLRVASFEPRFGRCFAVLPEQGHYDLKLFPLGSQSIGVALVLQIIRWNAHLMIDSVAHLFVDSFLMASFTFATSGPAPAPS